LARRSCRTLENTKAAMSIRLLVSGGLLVVLQTSCASSSNSPPTIAAVGRITETAEVPAGDSPSQGIYRPGMGGAIGGAVAGLANALRTDPAHTIYVIQVANGSKRYVRSQEKWAIGACVAITTERTHAGQGTWKYGEASLSAAITCE
jgi:hypothetical protein